MWVFIAVMLVTGLWVVFGAGLHGGPIPMRETGGEVWWWDSGHPSPPVSETLARPPRRAIG